MEQMHNMVAVANPPWRFPRGPMARLAVLALLSSAGGAGLVDGVQSVLGWDHTQPAEAWGFIGNFLAALLSAAVLLVVLHRRVLGRLQGVVADIRAMAEQMGPAVVKAWLAVLPAGTILAPVGGITPDNMQVFIDAGVKGFGLGSGLFKPGMTPEDVAVNAKAYVAAWNALR